MVGICARTLRNWMRAGTIPPPLRINRQVIRWHPDVIEARFRPATTNTEGPVNETPVNETPTDDRLLTSRDVANRLAVSCRTLWRMVKLGTFCRPVRRNRKWVRWKASDVAAWIERLVTA